MKIHLKLLAIAMLSGLLAAPAFAVEGEEVFADQHSGPGPYVFITGGMGDEYNACLSPMIPTGAGCSERSALFRVGFGYQYTPMWALEASYGQVGNAKSTGYATYPAPVGAAQYRWNLSATALAIQAVATAHMTDSMAVFAKFGAAYVNYDESLNLHSLATTTNWYVAPTATTSYVNIAAGAGLRFDVTAHGSILLLGEYYGQNDIYNVYGLTNKVRLVMGSVGLMWRY